MRPAYWSRSAAFFENRDGSTSMIFGLSVVPILLLVAAGIDYSRAIDQKSKLQQATDSATLAATRLLSNNPSQATLKSQAQAFLLAAVSDPNAVITSGPTVSSNQTALCMSTATTLNTSMMRVAVGVGIAPPSSMTVSANSCTKINDQTAEVALVLDNSGSMGAATNGTTKIQSLITAASKMVDILNPVPTSPRASFSIVPFSAAVNIGSQYQNATFMDTAGKSSIHWQNFQLPTAAGSALPKSKFDLIAGMNTNLNPVTWGGCVEERPEPYMTTDTVADPAIPDTLFVPYFYPDIHKASYNSNTGTYSWSSSTNTYITLDSTGEAGSCSNNDIYDQADASATHSSIPTKNTVANTVWNATQTKVCKYLNSGKLNDVLTGNSAFGSGFSVGPNLLCDSRPITTLTNDSAAVKTQINALYAKGDTNLVGGIMWGWRTISPNGPFNTQTTAATAIGNRNAKPYQNTTGSTAVTNVKYMILMTDGMNHWANISSSSDPNSSAYSNLGFYGNGRLGSTNVNNYRDLMDAKTLAACTNIKAKGIQLFTVGFSTSDSPIDDDGKALLQQCATNSNMSFIAPDGNTLIADFESIARQMSGLRLTQ